ncbi:hypothetical protein ColKHC_08726 [Colletotrichum higginsianum]|nr:hypothetical protein ColKHC_08726 [Colletotrichum higginsianum]
MLELEGRWCCPPLRPAVSSSEMRFAPVQTNDPRHRTRSSKQYLEGATSGDTCVPAVCSEATTSSNVATMSSSASSGKKMLTSAKYSWIASRYRSAASMETGRLRSWKSLHDSGGNLNFCVLDADADADADADPGVVGCRAAWGGGGVLAGCCVCCPVKSGEEKRRSSSIWMRSSRILVFCSMRGWFESR